MKQKLPISERWVLYIARNSKWRGWSFVWLTLGLCFFVMYHASDRSNVNILYMGAIWLFLAVVYFERATFYRIIQAKDAEIERLRSAQTT